MIQPYIIHIISYNYNDNVYCPKFLDLHLVWVNDEIGSEFVMLFAFEVCGPILHISPIVKPPCTSVHNRTCTEITNY